MRAYLPSNSLHSNDRKYISLHLFFLYSLSFNTIPTYYITSLNRNANTTYLLHNTLHFSILCLNLHGTLGLSPNLHTSMKTIEVGMAMPKSTQTRFVGIIDNHNQYTSLRLLFLTITDLLMSICSRHAMLGVLLTWMWENFVSCQSMFIHSDYNWLFMIPMLLKKQA